MVESRQGPEPDFTKSIKRIFFGWLFVSSAILAAYSILSAWTASDALAADVFIDEGEDDFEKPTPVDSPGDVTSEEVAQVQPTLSGEDGDGVPKGSIKKATESVKNKVKSAKVIKATKTVKASKASMKRSRQVANAGSSVGRFLKTTRDCAMESAPGAGDVVGRSKSKRKLWVEDAGDSGYWKVYSKSGQAGYLSRSCF
jgi:hypothetical protein